MAASKMKTAVLNLRDRFDLSQGKLANIFGLSGRNAVSRWETGERGLPEFTYRIIRMLNDVPKSDAKKILSKLESYNER